MAVVNQCKNVGYHQGRIGLRLENGPHRRASHARRRILQRGPQRGQRRFRRRTELTEDRDGGRSDVLVAIADGGDENGNGCRSDAVKHGERIALGLGLVAGQHAREDRDRGRGS